MICGWGVGIMSLYAVDGMLHLEASRREGIRRAGQPGFRNAELRDGRACRRFTLFHAFDMVFFRIGIYLKA